MLVTVTQIESRKAGAPLIHINRQDARAGGGQLNRRKHHVTLNKRGADRGPSLGSSSRRSRIGLASQSRTRSLELPRTEFASRELGCVNLR